MEETDISMLLGKVANALDDDQLHFWNVKIEWEAIASIFDIFEEVGTYEDGIFNKYPTDIIIAKIFKKDRFLFKNVFSYVADRYELPILKECMGEYESIFENDLNLPFDNEFGADNLKMFISFNSNDVEEAVKIKEFFENCGVDCFLSETDIGASEKYKPRTFEEICKADIFIYLLSKYSKDSDWCDQEMGMAYMKQEFGKAKIFIASNDGTEPYGFLSGLNAIFTSNSNYLFDIARKIDEKFNSSLVETIYEYYDDLLNPKIKELNTVGNYVEAKSLLLFINKRSNLLDKNQLERICDAVLRNNQIYECIICKEPLTKILSDCKDLIDDDLYQQVFNKINPV